MSDEKDLKKQTDEASEQTEDTASKIEEATEQAKQKVNKNTTPPEEAVDGIVQKGREVIFADKVEVEIGDQVEIIGGNPEEKDKSKVIIPVIIAVVIIAALVILAVIFGPKMFNKYNRMGYIDTSGKTVQQVAEEMGMTVDEFKEEYGLPADLPGNTTESAAYYNMPVSRIAAMYGMDFETLKETLEWDDTITEESTWGEAEGSTKLSVYVGEENFPEFKEFYGLGDEITGDTLWKEIRTTIDEKNREEQIKAEKTAKEAQKNQLTNDLTSGDGVNINLSDDEQMDMGDMIDLSELGIEDLEGLMQEESSSDSNNE